MRLLYKIKMMRTIDTYLFWLCVQILKSIPSFSFNLMSPGLCEPSKWLPQYQAADLVVHKLHHFSTAQVDHLKLCGLSL